MTRTNRHTRTFSVIASILTFLISVPSYSNEISLEDVFVSGESGYHTFRIPAIVTTNNGTLLAFCEGRRGSRSDSGDIDIVLKRSTDNGATWGDLQVVWDDQTNTSGNPCPLVDRETGRIWLPMTWNHGTDHESKIMTGESSSPRRVFITSSNDDGLTWSNPTEISDTTRADHWRWYATGPGNGIQLERGPNRGRLVVPANHSDHDHGEEVHPYRTHVFYSDDHGKTWQLGGVLDPATNESTIVELEDGSILDNMRSYLGKNRRAIATSSDGGETWSATKLDDTLIEPVCQANMIRANFSDPETRTPGRILFSNPASTKRERMTVRMSLDDGATWPHSKIIYPGSSAYSCMTMLPDGDVGLLFERDGYSKISFTSFAIEELEKEHVNAEPQSDG